MDKNKVSFIRLLREYNYTQKQACIITKTNKSTMSRIWNDKTYKEVDFKDYRPDRELENKKNIFDIISECREIPGIGGLSEDDKAYIKLLRYCNVDYRKARKLYYDVSIKEFKNTWEYINEVDFKNFNSKLIGIDKEDFEDFLK